MKKRRLLCIAISIIAAMGLSNFVAAQESTICKTPIASLYGNGGAQGAAPDNAALVTVATLPNGNITITLDPVNDNNPVFRDGGIAGNAGNGFEDIKVSGVANTGSALLTKSISGNVLTLTPVTPITNGTAIEFANIYFEYQTNTALGLWPALTFTYTYGSACPVLAKLATPTNVAVDGNNVLTFNGVPDATGYAVRVFSGSSQIRFLNVTGSGETISLPVSGNFTVTVSALDDTNAYDESEQSVSCAWISTAVDQPVGSSPICAAQFGDAPWGVFISIETATETNDNIQAGDIIFTLSGNGAGFRGQGARLANITVDGMSGLLTKVSGDSENPNVFRPVSGITIAKGTPVVYNGEFEALSAANNNIYGNRTFSYVYGTACTAPQLTAPSALALGTDNALTFTSDANAESTTIYVYSGDVEIYSVPNFESGTVLDFPINGSFTVKGQSMPASADYQKSELSAGIPFTVAVADAVVGETEYCEWEFNPEGDGSAAISAANPNDEPDSDIAYLTWETASDGSIVITLKGTDANAGTTEFRAPAGFSVSNLTIGGMSAINFVTPEYGSTQAKFTPVAGITIPKGTNISYNGMVLYRVAADAPGTELDNLWPNATFSYTYGSVCSSTTTAVSGTDQSSLSVYPTSVSNALYIAGLNTVEKVTIINALGATVDTGISTGEVNVSGLSSGIYFLLVKGQAFKFVKK